ncbi:hypothetical protein [Ferruginibacter sp.]|uniref:hypothetical protein n=1 Tax=Ferruginibacter sp. TaxID=1940288 RepID=UPI00265ADEC2|nr:hypothetical protein [Ferruginibacter sp.]
MRLLCSLLSTTFLCFCSCGQSNSKKIHFTEIGMTVNVPAHFNLQDSSPTIKYLDSNQNPIKDSLQLKELQQDAMKLLLSVTSSDNKNSMSINIVPINQKSIQTYGDSLQYFELSKMLIEATAKQSTNKFETIDTIMKINGNNLYKYFAYSRLDSNTFFNGFYFSKMKGYFLIVKIDYVDEKLEIS